MIGLDTNVLVRYIVQDEEEQSRKATQVIEGMSAEEPGYITIVSVIELVWVLKSSYQATKPEIITVLETLLRTRELVVESAELVWQAVRLFAEANGDFADCLIERSAHHAGCEYTVTFDAKAVKTVGMRKLK